MKIILKENIENLGKRGDIIEVAAGYGRNYLIPRKLAIEVTPSNMKMVELEQKTLWKKLEQEVKSYQSVIDQLNQTSLTFDRKAGDKDVIFGSVSAADIKEALDKLGMNVEKKKILLDEPIKRLGNFTVPVKVFHDERAEIKIEVKKEGETVEEPKPGVIEQKTVEDTRELITEENKEESPIEPLNEELEKPSEIEGKGDMELKGSEVQDEKEKKIPEKKGKKQEDEPAADLESNTEDSGEDKKK